MVSEEVILEAIRRVVAVTGVRIEQWSFQAVEKLGAAVMDLPTFKLLVEGERLSTIWHSEVRVEWGGRASKL